MATQSHALRLMLAADAFDHIEAGGHRPHAVGHCSNCGRVIIGWSAYAW